MPDGHGGAHAEIAGAHAAAANSWWQPGPPRVAVTPAAVRRRGAQPSHSVVSRRARSAYRLRTESPSSLMRWEPCHDAITDRVGVGSPMTSCQDDTRRHHQRRGVTVASSSISSRAIRASECVQLLQRKLVDDDQCLLIFSSSRT